MTGTISIDMAVNRADRESDLAPVFWTSKTMHKGTMHFNGPIILISSCQS